MTAMVTPEENDSGNIPISKAEYSPGLKDKPRRLMFQ
jgi:hypothetical protein